MSGIPTARLILTTACTLALSVDAIVAQPASLLSDTQRIVFLGDSNTFAGGFISYMDAYLVTRFPDKRFELINLGLPSETVSGLSEPDHPYPRPDVHTRLERALQATKPNLVIACYGMNDGIYHPFNADRLAKYQAGFHKLIDRVRAAGAKVVLVTPAPFDPRPIAKNLLPKGEPKYSWMKPFAEYDDVLARYAAWLVTLRDKGIPVVDAHGAMQDALQTIRTKEPAYFFSGDGIHPNPTGHAIIASRLLQALGAPDEVDLAEVDWKMMRGINGKVTNVVVAEREICFEWLSKTPMPLDPRWHPRLAEIEKLTQTLNRFDLILTRGPFDAYELFEGDVKLGQASRAEIKIGLDMTRFAKLSANVRAAEVGKLALERQKLLGLAWLTHVGHERPGTPKGLPLEEATRQATKLEARMRQLAQPQMLKLRLLGK